MCGCLSTHPFYFYWFCACFLLLYRCACFSLKKKTHTHTSLYRLEKKKSGKRLKKKKQVITVSETGRDVCTPFHLFICLFLLREVNELAYHVTLFLTSSTVFSSERRLNCGPFFFLPFIHFSLGKLAKSFYKPVQGMRSIKKRQALKNTLFLYRLLSFHRLSALRRSLNETRVV